MNFVGIIDNEDNSVFINPKHVVFLEPSQTETDGTDIWLVGQQLITTKESPNEIRVRFVNAGR